MKFSRKFIRIRDSPLEAPNYLHHPILFYWVSFFSLKYDHMSQIVQSHNLLNFSHCGCPENPSTDKIGWFIMFNRTKKHGLLILMRKNNNVPY